MVGVQLSFFSSDGNRVVIYVGYGNLTILPRDAHIRDFSVSSLHLAVIYRTFYRGNAPDQ